MNIKKFLEVSEKETFKRIFNFKIYYHKHPKINKDNPILKIKNKITDDETFFNLKRIQYVLKKKKSKCSFCNWKKDTIVSNIVLNKNSEKKSWIIVDNLYPYDLVHSLLIYKKHDIKKFNSKILEELLERSLEWFNFYLKQNKKLLYPILGINFGKNAGASLSHPHFHILISKEPYSFEKKLIKNKNKYFKKFKKDYFEDYFHVAKSLKLGFKIKDLKIFATLTSPKGFQVYALFKKLKSFFLLNKIFNLFIKYELAFNFVFLPSFENNKHRKENLAVFLIRNKNKFVSSDFGFMEIFGSSIANFDPYLMFRKIRQSLKI